MESLGALSDLFFPARQRYPIFHFSYEFSSSPTTQKIKCTSIRPLKILCYSNITAVTAPQKTEEDVEENLISTQPLTESSPPQNQKKRTRYRKLYPGEKDGITEEMRFIAMKLRNSGKPKKRRIRRKKDVEYSEELDNGSSQIDDNEENDEDDNGISVSQEEEEEDNNGDGNEENNEDGNGISVSQEEDSNGDVNGETWEPTMDGFLKYLVDSKLVFSTIERIVDESDDVSYAYFRKTGLERTEFLLKDIEFLSRQEGNQIPEPSNPGIIYSKYLEELGEKSPNLFLCHLYNIYFSHIAGGQLIAKRVSDQLLNGRELGFCKWEGEEEDSLRILRKNLNTLSEHWSRDEKNKCLKETTKAFRFLGQIVRLIVL